MEDEPLPSSDMEERTFRFWQWNGDLPAPQFTHWTPEGTIILRAATPGTTSEVIWRPKDGPEVHAGYGGPHASSAAMLIAKGGHDKDAGYPLSQIAPQYLEEWNNLGG